MSARGGFAPPRLPAGARALNDHGWVIKVPSKFDRAMTMLIRFWIGLKQLRGRILPDEPTVKLAGTSEMEAMTFAWMCSNFRSAARFAARASAPHYQAKIYAAIAAFDASAPHVKDLRDIFSHLDDYLEGKGKLQRGLKDPYLNVYYGAGQDFTLYVTLAPGTQLQIEVDKTRQAADQLVAAIDRIVDPG